MLLKTISRFYFPTIFPVILVLCFAVTAPADTRYVSDQLIISIREGQAPEDQIIGYLISDTPVEVLEEDETLLKVRTKDGLEGWVKSKYILTRTPKAITIDELKARIVELETEIETIGDQDPAASTDDFANTKQKYDLKIKQLEFMVDKERQAATSLGKELTTLRRKHKELQKNHDSLLQNNAELSQKTDNTSATLSQEVTVLKQANAALEKELGQLNNVQSPPLLSGNIKWFLTGSGVLLFGIILGRLARRKRSYPY